MKKIVLSVFTVLSLQAGAQQTSACYDLYAMAAQVHSSVIGFFAAPEAFFLWQAGVATAKGDKVRLAGAGVTALAMGYGFGHAANRALFSQIVAGTIAEARGNGPGAYSTRAAQMINNTLSETVPFYQRYRMSAPERASLRGQLGYQPVLAKDVVHATRVLDASNGLCTPEAGVLKPSDWVRVMVSILSSSR